MITTLNDIFDVRYGHSLELNRLRRTSSENGIAFVSRKMDDNGVSAFVERNGLEPANPGTLTCALSGNGVLSTFLQERPFYTAYHVAVLTPRREFDRSELLYYAMCIRANRYRYSYGRQANRTIRLLSLPSPSEIPDWVNDAKFNSFSDAYEPRGKAVPLRETTDWQSFQMQELFEIRKGKRLTKANMLRGSTPFIGAIDSTNGVTGFVGQRAIHRGNTITVNYNGNGVAEAFYQPVPFWCSDDVNVLYPRFAMTPAIALFIATVIRKEKFRYSYGRKWDMARMKASAIRLPTNGTTSPDLKFMEQYISSLPFSGQL